MNSTSNCSPFLCVRWVSVSESVWLRGKSSCKLFNCFFLWIEYIQRALLSQIWILRHFNPSAQMESVAFVMEEILIYPLVWNLKRHSSPKPLKVGSVFFFAGIFKLSFSQWPGLPFGSVQRAIVSNENIVCFRNRAVLKIILVRRFS